MVKLVVIDPDPNIADEVFFVDKKEAFEKCQELVGGYIERIRVNYEQGVYDCWLDEEGLLKGLPPNPRIIKMDIDRIYRGGMPLVGTGVIWIP
jgi:hypothetical protein